MKKPVVICDDSSMAQKMLMRSLPDDWDVEITFAGNGQEALSALRDGKAEYLFLDLNMPVMDGYETLQAMREEGLSANVIVVSGDIQPEAYRRVMDLGATAFIKKPVDTPQLDEILRESGAYNEDSRDSQAAALKAAIDLKVDLRDACQEITNVAVGRAADLLARLLDVFVIMPIPLVNTLDPGELQMALQSADNNDKYSAICQGFIGSGISGEALLLFHESSIEDIAKLMKFHGALNDSAQLELLMDVTSVLIGACLKGLSEQLDVEFSQSHPVVLGRHMPIADVISTGTTRWKQTLAIEVHYRIEDHNIQCDLLLLFTEDSIETLNTKLAYIT